MHAGNSASRFKPSPSMVVALIALFVSASGVTWAASELPKDSVKSKQIANGAVKHRDLAHNSVNSNTIEDESIGTFDLQFDAVNSDTIEDGTVQYWDLGFDAVNSDTIEDESIQSWDLGFDSVNSDTVEDASIQSSDLGSDSVNSDTVEDGSITRDDLGESSVGAPQLAGQIVTRTAETPTPVDGGTAENNSYQYGSSTVFCEDGEQIISGYGTWDPDDIVDTAPELTIASVQLDPDAQSVTVEGGNDSGSEYGLVAVAVCLAP